MKKKMKKNEKKMKKKNEKKMNEWKIKIKVIISNLMCG
jgi:hypothetical protein